MVADSTLWPVIGFKTADPGKVLEVDPSTAVEGVVLVAICI